MLPVESAPETVRRSAPRKLPDGSRSLIPPPKSLKQNFSWTFVSNVVYTGCQWGILMSLTRMGTPELVGQFVLGLAITTPPMCFANLKARGIQASDARREFSFSEYLGLTLVLTTLALLVIAGSTLAGGYGRETGLVILAVGLGKAIDVVSDVFFGLYQQNEHMDRIARPLMVNGFLSLAALAGAVYLTGSVVWGAVGWASAKGVVFILYNLCDGAYVAQVEGLTSGFTGMRALMPSWSAPRLLRLAWLTFPLCLATLLVQLNANIPRYFIEHYLGERQLAFFAAMAFLMAPGNMMLVAALGQAAMPRLAHSYADGDIRGFLALLLRLVGLVGLGSGLAVVAVLVAGRTVLSLLYTPEYAQQTDVLVLITLEAALGFVGSFLAYALTAARHFRAQAVLSGAGAVMACTACALLIPRYGLFGAALATVLATSLQLLGSIGVVGLAVRTRRHG